MPFARVRGVVTLVHLIQVQSDT